MQPDQFYSRTFRLVIVFTCFKLKKKYKTKNRLKDLCSGRSLALWFIFYIPSNY